LIRGEASRWAGNRILAVYDLSIMRNGANGIYFLADGVVIKEILEPPYTLTYGELRALGRQPCAYACVRLGPHVINLPEFGMKEGVATAIAAATTAALAGN
jgi:hypothetical protein